MGNNSYKIIPLLGIAHPIEGKIILDTVSVREDDAHYRPLLRKKSDCSFDMYFVKMY